MSAQNAARAPSVSDGAVTPEAGAPELAALVDELRAYLAGLSEGKLSVEAIDPTAHLLDFGYVDSLSAVMFVAHLEQRYGVRLEELDLLERFTTLEQVAVQLQASRA